MADVLLCDEVIDFVSQDSFEKLKSKVIANLRKLYIDNKIDLSNVDDDLGSVSVADREKRILKNKTKTELLRKGNAGKRVNTGQRGTARIY